MNSTPAPRTIEVELVGGLVAELRPILPTDAPLLEEGFNDLSESSRFARFGFGIDHLTNHELRYLTDVDLVNHVAWGAIIDGNAAGISRYVVLPGEDCAEVAVTVVDRYQQRGLGRRLFDALAAVARHDVLTAFCFEVAPTNEPVRRLFRDIVGQNADTGLLHGRMPVSDLPDGDHDSEFVALIEHYRAASWS